VQINLKRVSKDLEELAGFTATPGFGVTRLPFTKEDRAAREYLKKEMKKIGLAVWEDGYGTIFGRREGSVPEPCVMIGSHYDSVICGGAFDGAAGVVAALEIMRVLEESGFQNHFPLEMTAMNDEEGVRFGRGLANSQAMAGLLSSEDLVSVKDKNGVSVQDAMLDFGIMPALEKAKRQPGSLKAFLELHIEQGPILDDRKIDLGLVEVIVGLEKYEAVLEGASGHAGTTPMEKRRDALRAAAELILEVGKIAEEIGRGTVATVGELSLKPNAANVIPQQVELSIDIRAMAEADLRKAAALLRERAAVISRRSGVAVDLTKTMSVMPVTMAPGIVNLAAEISGKLGYSYLKMASGAAHDAMIMNRLAPAGLIFVPSKGGLSHQPGEWTDYEDLKKGIEVMLQAVIQLSGKDRQIAEGIV